MIHIHNLTKNFHTGEQIFEIFSDLNLSIQSGECVAIV